MKKEQKRTKKLHVNRETLTALTPRETAQAAGGNTLTCFFSCAYGCQTIGGAGKAEQPCIA